MCGQFVVSRVLVSTRTTSSWWATPFTFFRRYYSTYGWQLCNTGAISLFLKSLLFFSLSVGGLVEELVVVQVVVWWWFDGEGSYCKGWDKWRKWVCEDLEREVGLKVGMEDMWCRGNGFDGQEVCSVGNGKHRISGGHAKIAFHACRVYSNSGKWSMLLGSHSEISPGHIQWTNWLLRCSWWWQLRPLLQAFLR